MKIYIHVFRSIAVWELYSRIIDLSQHVADWTLIMFIVCQTICSPIYKEEDWSPTGDVYVGGK